MLKRKLNSFQHSFILCETGITPSNFLNIIATRALIAKEAINRTDLFMISIPV